METGFTTSSVFINGRSKNKRVLDMKNDHGQVWRIEGMTTNESSPEIRIGVKELNDNVWKCVGISE